MGNCIGTNIILNRLTDKFINYNIINKEYNIIIGIYIDTQKSKNSNTLINQGICIGYNNNEINKIKFGIIHPRMSLVELFFENNISLSFVREINNKNNNDTKIKMILTFKNCKIIKYIDNSIIKKIKSINNNSEDIDLIYRLL